MNRECGAVLAASLLCLLVVSGGPACTKQEGQQVVTALSTVASCEVKELLLGAVEDPVLLLTGCAATDAGALLTLVEQLLSDPSEPDGSAALKIEPFRLPLPVAQHLQRVAANLVQFMAKDGG